MCRCRSQVLQNSALCCRWSWLHLSTWPGVINEWYCSMMKTLICQSSEADVCGVWSSKKCWLQSRPSLRQWIRQLHGPTNILYVTVLSSVVTEASVSHFWMHVPTTYLHPSAFIRVPSTSICVSLRPPTPWFGLERGPGGSLGDSSQVRMEPQTLRFLFQCLLAPWDSIYGSQEIEHTKNQKTQRSAIYSSYCTCIYIYIYIYKYP